MIDKRLAIWYSLIALWLLLMAAVLSHAESPESLMNSTANMSLEEAAFLLATHGYNITYAGGVFLLNGTEFRQCPVTGMYEEYKLK
jgi:hypothetical protein